MPRSYGTGPLLLEGSLAMALHAGGPYSQMPADEALHLATQFREALAGSRFDDLVVLTGSGWSPWFAQMGWDHGWIITDILDARTYLLCASGDD